MVAAAGCHGGDKETVSKRTWNCLTRCILFAHVAERLPFAVAALVPRSDYRVLEAFFYGKAAQGSPKSSTDQTVVEKALARGQTSSRTRRAHVDEARGFSNGASHDNGH